MLQGEINHHTFMPLAFTGLAGQRLVNESVNHRTVLGQKKFNAILQN